MTEIPTASRLIVGARDLNRCCRCGMPGATDWHHRRTRAVVDEHQHCPCNGALLCRTCHSWAHQHPTEARRTGFIVSRYESEPSTVAVQSPWGTRLHLCDGSVRYEEQP